MVVLLHPDKKEIELKRKEKELKEREKAIKQYSKFIAKFIALLLALPGLLIPLAFINSDYFIFSLVLMVAYFIVIAAIILYLFNRYLTN